MANITMAELRAKLLAEKAKKAGQGSSGGSGGDNASYPFWNIAEGQSALVRFLRDGDQDNDFFWRRRDVIKLPFVGVVGGEFPTNKPVTVQVPCVEMWGDTCPILSQTKPWWKEPGKEALARTYWKKKSYLFQGFVVNSPFEESAVPANPIRRFVINQSIFDVVHASLMDAEFEDLPYDEVGGRDFKITKTRKGEYANYSTSSWSFKTRTLSADELSAIEQHGLFSLKDFLGRRPDAEELEVIKAMFQDSLDGLPFDHESYGKFFRAFGSRDDSAQAGSAAPAAPSPRVVAATAAAAPPLPVPAALAVEDDEPEPAPAPRRAAAPPEATPAAEGNKSDVSAILARIKNRQPAAAG